MVEEEEVVVEEQEGEEGGGLTFRVGCASSVRISRRRMTDGKSQGVEASRRHGIGRRCSRDSAEAAVPGRGKGRADCPQAL